MNASVTNEEILAELRKAACHLEAGVTMEEFADALGLASCSAWRRMRALVKAGAWRYVPVKRANITGAVKTVPGYQPVKRARR